MKQEISDEELKALQRKVLRRARLVSISLGLAFAIAVISFLYGFTQSIEAEKQSIVASEQRDIAVKMEKRAIILEEQLKLCQSEKSK